MDTIKEQVTKYLKSINTGKTPTEIGLALGKSYDTASSSVSSALKSLIDDELVTKSKIDGKVLYKWNRKPIPFYGKV
jgi:DNA-binding transcriptional ArsR family regulator